MSSEASVAGPQVAGQVAAVRGAVVEVEFPGALPAIHEALRVQLDDREIVLEVVLHVDFHTVRALAMEPVAGLARGAPARPQRDIDRHARFAAEHDWRQH